MRWHLASVSFHSRAYRRRAGLTLVAAWGFGTSLAFAAAPVLDHLFPSAVQSGATNSITLVGKFDPWPPALWADSPGFTFLPATNASALRVIVAPGVRAGPHWIRAYAPDGASIPHLLVVTPNPLILEQEPNDSFQKPQRIPTLPSVVEGRLEKSGDVDSYSVALKRGETLVSWVDAFTLMTPMDLALRLIHTNNVQLAWNHDSVRSLDPFMTWTADQDGTYVVQVFGFAYPAESDVRFAGSPRGVYRLHLSTGPVLQHTLPLGAQRYTNTLLTLHGWNLGTNLLPIAFHPTEPEWVRPGFAEFQPPEFSEALEVPVGDGPEGLESEPNDTRDQANGMEIPGAISGDLNRPGDVDRFRFIAKKGQLLALEVQATRLGFPLDSWLKVEDASGKELARNDDAASADPRLDWTAPQDGTYFAAVGNLIHTGGTELRYRLQLQPSKPSLQVLLADHAYSVEPGKTNEIKVTLTRLQGFNASLRVHAEGLPPDVIALPVDVAPTAVDATLKVLARTNAVPFSGAFRILAAETPSGREHVAVHSLATTGENNGVPQGFNRLLREQISEVWFTILPATNSVPKPKG